MCVLRLGLFKEFGQSMVCFSLSTYHLDLTVPGEDGMYLVDWFDRATKASFCRQLVDCSRVEQRVIHSHVGHTHARIHKNSMHVWFSWFTLTFSLRHAWHHVAPAPQQKCKLAEPARHVKQENGLSIRFNSIECQFDRMNILCHADTHFISFHVLCSDHCRHIWQARIGKRRAKNCESR